MQNMWACILNFGDLSHKNFIVDFSSEKNLQYFVFFWGVVLSHFLSIYIYFLYFLIIFWAILIIRCFLCGLQWPFTHWHWGLARKGERGREEEKPLLSRDAKKGKKCQERSLNNICREALIALVGLDVKILANYINSLWCGQIVWLFFWSAEFGAMSFYQEVRSKK